MTNFSRAAFTLFLAAGLASAARADADAVIAKARAYLGSDAALDAVQSVHFTGSLVTTEQTATGTKPVQAVVEIIFEKPYFQRIVAHSDEGVEITALDNYDGWHRVENAKDHSRWNMELLSTLAIKRLRANTWENLAFFGGIGRIGGTVEDLGPANVDGVACEKLAFRHEQGIVFFRYFDGATGRLVLTETEQGGTIREEGEIMADGIRFPKKVVTTTKLADGKDRSVTVNFDKVSVNETFPESLFAIPSLSQPQGGDAPR